MDTHVVILAAGKGTRMKSARPKVLHRVAGKPLIERVLDCAEAIQPRTITVVLGHQADALRAALSERQGLTFVVQEPQLGTAHALMTAEPALAGQTGLLVLLSGDVPLLRPETLSKLVDCHRQTGAAASVITAIVDDPHGYGRIVRTGEQIAHIVEEKDASPAERTIREINSGIYAFSLDGLSMPFVASPPTMPSASTTYPTWWPSIAGGGRPWKPSPSRIRMKFEASTAASSWRQ